MKSRTFILISILTSFFTITSNAQVTSGLKIVSGKVDTVFRASHYIVGAAKPGSEIFINGISVKQYKTGSFGMEINLVEGNNPIVLVELLHLCRQCICKVEFEDNLQQPWQQQVIHQEWH